MRFALRAAAAPLALALVTTIAPATARGQTHAMPGGARPPFDSNRLGGVAFPVTTSSPEAQRLVSQGLALCYGFNHDEAIRSFERALVADSTCAMAWWGIALALGPNINLPMGEDAHVRAFAAVRRAQALSGALPARERDYVEALATRYAADPKSDRAALDRAYRDAMRGVVERHPDDLHAATLYAESIMDLMPWAYWTAAGEPAPDTPELMRVLDSVIARDSLHTGANHFLIHALESSPDPARGLVPARRLGSQAPAAGHLVHMPSHISIRTGRYAEAAEINVRAARVDSAYIEKHAVTGVYPGMYWGHNMDFAAVALMVIGRGEDALYWSRRQAALAAAAAADMPMVEPYAGRPYVVLAGTRQWKALLAEPEPPATLAVSHALWQFSRGLAHVATGDTPAASRHLAALDGERARIPADALMGTNTAGPVLRVASAMLTGRLARAHGDPAGAEAAYRRAIAAADSLAYNEPEDWLLPPRPWLASLLLERGDAAGADALLLEELTKRPASPDALLLRAAALRRLGRGREAAAALREHAAAWRGPKRTEKDL